MSISHPAYDNPATKRVALIYGCNPRTQSRYSGVSCGNVEVQIIRAADETRDGNSWGYRCADWSSARANPYFVYNLYLRCQFDLNSSPETDERYLYGFSARFMDMSYIDLETSQAMTRTLKRIETTWSQVSDSSGHSVEFARYLTAVLNKLGVEDFVCYKNDQSRGSLDNDANFWHILSFRELYQTIDRITAGIRNS